MIVRTRRRLLAGGPGPPFGQRLKLSQAPATNRPVCGTILLLYCARSCIVRYMSLTPCLLADWFSASYSWPRWTSTCLKARISRDGNSLELSRGSANEGIKIFRVTRRDDRNNVRCCQPDASRSIVWWNSGFDDAAAIRDLVNSICDTRATYE